MSDYEPTDNTVENTTAVEAAVEHDQRVKRWLLISSIIAALLAISTVLALAWGWNNSQRAVEAGQELATIVDRACEDPEVHDQLGTACPRAAEVKKEDPAEIPLPLQGPEGPMGPQGPPGQSIVGPQGPAGRSIVGPRGPIGPAGKAGIPGADSTVPGPAGSDGVNGTDGQDGRGIRSMRLTDNGELVVEFTDGTTANFGPLIGPRGPEGPAGPQGEPGVNGVDGAPGPTCPVGYIGQDTEVMTNAIPPEKITIFACVKQAA